MSVITESFKNTNNYLAFKNISVSNLIRIYTNKYKYISLNSQIFTCINKINQGGFARSTEKQTKSIHTCKITIYYRNKNLTMEVRSIQNSYKINHFFFTKDLTIC